MKISTIFSLFDKRTLFYYLSVGGTSALVYFLSFALLYDWLTINYKLAVSIAYVLSVILHFIANRRLTFQCHGSELFYHLAKYITMVAINYLITLGVMHIIVSQLNLSPYFGVACSISATVLTGYLMAKFWIFKPIVKV